MGVQVLTGPVHLSQQLLKVLRSSKYSLLTHLRHFVKKFVKEDKPKILVIVGPTASGKTSLSIQLAKKFNGEVISADSRQVYNGLNIGTGKVTKEEMGGIPHHLLDVANPQDTYTVSDFVRDGDRAIADILERGTLPIIVGGTFLYVDALLGKISTPHVEPNETLRAELEVFDTESLAERLKALDSARHAEIDTHNRRRLIRAIEIATMLGKVPKTTQELKYNTLTLGIAIDLDALKANIHNRLTKRLDIGMVDEVKKLHADGLSYERLSELGIEYKYIRQFLQGSITYEKMTEEIEIKSRQYAKRQMTWLKRDREIVWVDKNNTDDTESFIHNFLK